MNKVSTENSDSYWHIKSIKLSYLHQITDLYTLNKLKQNYILTKSKSGDEKVPLCLSNVCCSSSTNHLITSTFTKIDKQNESNETDFQRNELKPANLFPRINDQNLKLHDFVLITGKIMNICDENCCFELTCFECKNRANLNYEFENLPNVIFDQEQK
jgi:hypothetical protein